MTLESDRTEFGPVPTDWDITRLGDCLIRPPSYGINAPAVAHNTNLPTYIRITDITGDGRYSDSAIVSVQHPAATHYVLEPGDIVVARTGASVGKSYLYRPRDGRMTFAGFLIRLQPDPRRLLPEYLKYYMQSRFYWNWINANSMRSGQPGVSAREYAELRIPVPPTRVEQEAIARALSDADTLVESLEQLIAKKRQIKQGAMQELLTGKRRLPGFSGAWNTVRLGDLAQMNSGGTPPSGDASFYGGGIPWVSIADMTVCGKFIACTERTLSPAGLRNSAARIFPAGTVLYAMYASIGECSIAAVPLTSSQAILGIVPNDALDRRYLYYFLLSIKASVRSLGQQGTQANLNKRIVQNFRIQLPTVGEQAAIADTLSDMDAEIAALEHRCDKARAIKEGMMQTLLTGKIRLVPPRAA